MADDLRTDPDFIMALSSWESGWLDDHNYGLNNLFGITQAGKNNLFFHKPQDCADFWVRTYSRFVFQAKDMDTFVAGLRRVPYDTEYAKTHPDDPDGYYRLITEQLQSLRKHKQECGIR